MTTKYIYTDGSSINNGRKNCKSGYGIYFGENDCRNLSKRVIGKQSNNVAELTAILEAIKIIEPELSREEEVVVEKIIIFTDSKYSILCLTSYGLKCCKNKWTADIPNKDLVRETFELFQKYNSKLSVQHILAHTGFKDEHSQGNACADNLAKLSLFECH
jgi:ribonuclease HI